MALPYEGDTEFGRNGAYELTEHGEEVRPIAVKNRSSTSQAGTDYEFENQKPKGCWERTKKSCNDFFLLICPGCITQIPSVVLILLAIIVILFIILSVPLVFALVRSPAAAQIAEQPDQIPDREKDNFWPGIDGEERDDSGLSENNTLQSIEAMLPKNVSMCKGMGFVCASNPDITIGTYSRCDGVADCPDGSDEVNCRECQTSFSCPGGNGTELYCFRAEVLCDGTPQCDDRSDESMCASSTCDQFKCSDMCLPQTFVCDGESHCSDSSDEKDCKGKCKNDSKWCKVTETCIPKWKLCDGLKNCPDGSDENDCNCKTCSGKGKMLCMNDIQDGGFCVRRARICDGSSDCPNGIDEDGCPTKNDTLFGVMKQSMNFF